MTHKARILQMLAEAGDQGVSSKLLYREFMGRGAARIKELRDEGHRIDSSEKDPVDPKFCIYKLAGIEAQGRKGGPFGGSSPSIQIGRLPADERHAEDAACSPCLDSSETLFELDPPSAYNPWSEAA